METLYLYTGEEDFLKQEAIDKLKIQMLGEGKSAGLNYDKFDAEGDSLDKITECAKTMPFLSKYRLIVIDQINRLNADDKQTLASFIEAGIPSWCILVFTTDIQLKRLKLDGPLMQAVNKFGRITNFDTPNDIQLSRWLINKFADYKKSPTKDAVRCLLEISGNNLAQLHSTIESVITYVGKKDTVEIEDIQALAGSSLEATTFQLVDAICLKDKGTALKTLQNLLFEGKKPPEIIGLLGWHLRRICRAQRLLMQKKMSFSAVALSVGVRQYQKDKFIRQVKNFKLKELEEDFRVLAETDVALKSSMIPVQPGLEFLVVRLTASFSANTLHRRS